VSRPKNDTFLRALLKEPTEYTPLWLMRQAGRYLPEYCETRKRAGNFLNLCKSPAMACEVTLQPLARYDLDAAILFSDILTVPDAMGLGLYFCRRRRAEVRASAARRMGDQRPDRARSLRSSALRDGCRVGNPPCAGQLGAADRLLRQPLHAGLLHGRRRGVERFPQHQGHALQPPGPAAPHPVGDRRFGDFLPECPDRLRRPGRDDFRHLGRFAVQRRLQEFSLQYMQRIVAGLKKEKDGQRIPSIVFTKNGGLWLEKIAAIGCDAVGLDWTIDIGEARRRVGDKVALQGNLDPNVLFAQPEIVAAEAKKVLDSFGPGNTGHVFNLGHGISQFTPPESVTALVEAVHAHSRLLRK
jgi:uroporphyrinogen decarboxylase